MHKFFQCFQQMKIESHHILKFIEVKMISLKIYVTVDFGFDIVRFDIQIILLKIDLMSIDHH
jgi:hypothetical protein